MTEPGWVVTPKPVAPELEADGERFSGHIKDWASFAELVGPDAVKILAEYMSVGEPTP